MKHFGDDYLRVANIKTPYQIKREVAIRDFLQSQDDKKLASIIRMHQADKDDFKSFFDKL